MLRDFFVGFVKIHILYHAGEAPVYGLELVKELARHGYQISPGTLYPTLHNLEERGYLVGEKRLVEGRWRKYYTLTESGQVALEEARARIRELVREVLAE